jgi:hypothetical protein
LRSLDLEELKLPPKKKYKIKSTSFANLNRTTPNRYKKIATKRERYKTQTLPRHLSPRGIICMNEPQESQAKGTISIQINHNQISAEKERHI